ncbi:MAG: iron ABC transporter permease [Victivallaceae bacterium]
MSPKDWNKILTIFLLLVALLLAMFFSLRGGAFELDWGTLAAIIRGEENSVQARIITEIRLPRVIIGVLVGSALALSGALLQSVLHNILASPGIIGVSAGAGLGGILVLLILPGWQLGLLPAAFLGGLTAVGLVWLLTWRGGASPGKLILAGVAVSSLFSAVSSFILLWHSERAGGLLDFTVGSLANRGWEQINQIYLWVLLGVAVAFYLAGHLNLLNLGDDLAASLGVRVNLVRTLGVAVGALLAAAAVSAAGLLGFVGLIAPHMVRMMLGSDLRFVVPGSLIMGALLVVMCDYIGRTIMAPAELPVGIIMALLGAPFFLWLLRRREYAA